ncbi:hypothetical protein B0O99DRAFT_598815 [Bisporella sp. PMI_857]|nr:hypothetical protein B0O99DRAFT_598815 [Bisporella sp. PMI_857]
MATNITIEEPISPPRVVFKEPNLAKRRGSVASSRSNASSTAIDDDHYEDWTTTTAEKDTWANRERRRSSIFAKIDDIQPVQAFKPSSPTSSGGLEPLARGERRGSILSLWTSGKDKDGRHVLHSDGEHVHKWDVEKKREERGSKGSMERERHGSILSLFTNSKDEKGRSIISSG